MVGGIRNVDAFDGVFVGEQVGEELQYRGVVECPTRAADVLELLRELGSSPGGCRRPKVKTKWLMEKWFMR